jgi:acyl CoA:acetate/3-ketoacid CoA transferase
MQKGRVMLRVAGGIPYELTRGRVKRLNLHVRRDGTVALSIPLRTTLEAADAYVIAEAEEVVEVGQIDPDEVCTPGVCVDMVVKL